jgi:S1-C subfamily serine protease
MIATRQTERDRGRLPALAAVRKRSLRTWTVAALVLAQGALVLAFLTDRPRAPDVPGIVAGARPAVVTVLADTPLRPLPGKARIAATVDGGDGTAGLSRRGSGFVIDPAGLIATNHHVIAGAGRTAVRFADGMVRDAEIVGRDPRTDLALLRVQAGRPLPALAFADSAAVRIGEPVIVIGDPFGYAGSVSSGIVSGLDRTFDAVDPIGFLQHDAAVNPGSSGGPALNGAGEIIGVNTAIPDYSFFGSGVSLAIPANEAKQILVELAARGYVERARLGVSVQALEESLAVALGVGAERGCVVAAVDDGAPAAAAGIVAGDVITVVDGAPITAIRDLNRALLARRPGDSVEISVTRRNGEERLRIRLDAAPPPSAAAPAITGTAAVAEGATPLSADFGLAFDDEIRGKGRGSDPPGETGLRIRGVEPGSLGERVGLAAGDRIIAVGRDRVGDSHEFTRLVDAAAGNVALLVRRDGDGQQFVVVPRASASSGGTQSWGNRGSARAGPL